MKEDKELIKEIVDRLKTSQEYPYKEGSWEKFKTLDKSSSIISRIWQKYTSIAAALIVSLGVLYYLLDTRESIQDNKNIGESIVKTPVEAHGNKKEKEVELSTIKDNILNETRSSLKAYKTIESKYNEPDILSLNLPVFSKLELPELQIETRLQKVIPTVSLPYQSEKQKELLWNHLVSSNLSLANNVIKNNKSMSDVSPKFFRFADKFELGLFISPFTNSDNLKLGAGLTLTYNLTDKINLRTGASYNTYEVGILKNPFDDNSKEQVLTKVDNTVLQSPGLDVKTQQISRVTLPNIDAVTGFVQSVEIPLEIKYNLNKSFYAVAGLSYSMILSQERNAHYIENIDDYRLKTGFSANNLEKDTAPKLERKIVKSALHNVNPSTYSGFVNLSIGKKIDVNRKFKVSIEPYYKIPVGGYRTADMNYSNAGVRLMTNF